MNPIYEKLFDTYGCSILKEAENYDEDAICALLEQYADRLWIDGSTAGLGAGSVAVVTRLSESRTEPQAILP